jgi:hypothetical protein
MARVPRKIDSFNGWITRSDNRLQATNSSTGNAWWKDYGLKSAIANEWHQRTLSWNVLYQKREGRHDKVDNKDVRDAILSMARFAERPLHTIAGSSIAGNEDAFIFNFKIGRAKKKHAEKIEAQIIAEINLAGRGLLDIICRRANTKGRAGKEAGADCVQYAYALFDAGEMKQVDLKKVTPEDIRMKTGSSSRVHFNLDLGMENQGKWMVIYFRWHNTRHPALSGPWTGVQVLVVG